MYQDRELAIKLNEVLTKISVLIDEGRDLVVAGNCTDEDRLLYCRKMGKVLGVELLDVQGEIWQEHPDLVPEGAKPFPRPFLNSENPG